ncbi:type II toxin-antitoxin system PemK/MazF family toxin [Loigolactobacillus bifermentans]|uniref:Type II toxin-antitoxin system PemK/MazF family toxin n=1 Tax=Loigolactobacillus bifermentans DSM 20003 TaxID=1423726 RepID=A0A0R1GHG8_9LACO|nr:type II toxin-antitoxin system PemK/MazF family toxin [Loigolactobacillus bifermentans]KRK33321.1 hypothetical protein FC07_GL001246 [Loigolactobacillus bifermentans DSM 20003]QGG60833.1 type II toxin-antitoxin system PemK/MazF family toxin [Loigolactobacillus bifermentans]
MTKRKLQSGDILMIEFNPAKGTEMKKYRPALVISNDQYQQFFNTVIVVPISSAEKYRAMEKYRLSPLFVDLKPYLLAGDIVGTALLQHVRAIDPSVRSDLQPVGQINSRGLKMIQQVVQQFF